MWAGAAHNRCRPTGQKMSVGQQQVHRINNSWSNSCLQHMQRRRRKSGRPDRERDKPCWQLLRVAKAQQSRQLEGHQERPNRNRNTATKAPGTQIATGTRVDIQETAAAPWPKICDCVNNRGIEAHGRSTNMQRTKYSKVRSPGGGSRLRLRDSDLRRPHTARP